MDFNGEKYIDNVIRSNSRSQTNVHYINKREPAHRYKNGSLFNYKQKNDDFKTLKSICQSKPSIE